MATGITTYSPGGMSTNTSVPGYDGGDDDMLNFWNDMARRRRAASAPRVVKTQGLGSIGQHKGRVRMGGGNEGDMSNALSQRLMQAKVQAAEAEAQAAAGTAPMKLHPGGMGFTSAFMTPDAAQMSGAQRARFLPGNATQVGGFDEMSPDDEDFLIRMRAGRTRGPVA